MVLEKQSKAFMDILLELGHLIENESKNTFLFLLL